MPRTPTIGGLVVIALGVVVAFVVISLVFKIRYLAELEPPAQYNHPYHGPVVERVMPVAEVRAVCRSVGDGVIFYPVQTASNLLAYESGYFGAMDVGRLGLTMLGLTILVGLCVAVPYWNLLGLPLMVH
jgi:hypothetical protein